jgi:hypothetical protein
MFPQYQETLKPEFEKQKRQLIIQSSFDDRKGLAQAKTSLNGVE